MLQLPKHHFGGRESLRQGDPLPPLPGAHQGARPRLGRRTTQMSRGSEPPRRQARVEGISERPLEPRRTRVGGGTRRKTMIAAEYDEPAEQDYDDRPVRRGREDYHDDDVLPRRRPVEKSSAGIWIVSFLGTLAVLAAVGGVVWFVDQNVHRAKCRCERQEQGTRQQHGTRQEGGRQQARHQSVAVSAGKQRLRPGGRPDRSGQQSLPLADPCQPGQGAEGIRAAGFGGRTSDGRPRHRRSAFGAGCRPEHEEGSRRQEPAKDPQIEDARGKRQSEDASFRIRLRGAFA